MKEYSDHRGGRHYLDPKKITGVSLTTFGGYVTAAGSKPKEWTINIYYQGSYGLQQLIYDREDQRDAVYNRMKQDIEDAKESK